MLVERAELPITPGREEEFAAAMASALSDLLEGEAAAERIVSFARGVENPSLFLLLVEWPSVEAHMAFRETPQFAAFAGKVREFYSGPPYMEHFETV